VGHDSDFQGSFFALEIDGLKEVAWFTGCSGLGIDLETVKFKEGNGTMVVERKRAGKPTYKQIELKRGLTTSTDLQDWFKDVAVPTAATPYKKGAIMVYDRKKELGATFSLTNCWPSKLAVSDLSAGSDSVMVESLTIEHESIMWEK